MAWSRTTDGAGLVGWIRPSDIWNERPNAIDSEALKFIGQELRDISTRHVRKAIVRAAVGLHSRRHSTWD